MCALYRVAILKHLLSTIYFLMFSEIPKDEEFLEAVISAMRSLLQMIASKNIPQVENIPQLQPVLW